MSSSIAPDFDLAAEKLKLLEYVSRIEKERREPTRKYELHEPEGWSTRLRDEIEGAEVYVLDITREQREKYRGVELGDEQVRWHRDNDIRVTQPLQVLDADGDPFAIYIPHYLPTIWGEEQVAEIGKNLEDAVNLLNLHHFISYKYHSQVQLVPGSKLLRCTKFEASNILH